MLRIIMKKTASNGHYVTYRPKHTFVGSDKYNLTLVTYIVDRISFDRRHISDGSSNKWPCIISVDIAEI